MNRETLASRLLVIIPAVLIAIAAMGPLPDNWWGGLLAVGVGLVALVILERILMRYQERRRRRLQ